MKNKQQEKQNHMCTVNLCGLILKKLCLYTGAAGWNVRPDSGCNTSEDGVCSRYRRFTSKCDNPSDRNDSATGESYRCHEDCYTSTDTTVGDPTAAVATTKATSTKDGTAHSGTVQDLGYRSIF
jgi:hypothetical protein